MFIIPSVLTRSLTPLTEMQLQSMTEPPPCFTPGCKHTHCCILSWPPPYWWQCKPEIKNLDFPRHLVSDFYCSSCIIWCAFFLKTGLSLTEIFLLHFYQSLDIIFSTLSIPGRGLALLPTWHLLLTVVLERSCSQWPLSIVCLGSHRHVKKKFPQDFMQSCVKQSTPMIQ